MTSIRTTVATAVPGPIPETVLRYVDRAIEALEDREQQIANAVATYAKETYGYSDEQAAGYLEHVGLPRHTNVEPTEDVADLSRQLLLLESIQGNVQGLVERVDRLTRFAQQHGYAG